MLGRAERRILAAGLLGLLLLTLLAIIFHDLDDDSAAKATVPADVFVVDDKAGVVTTRGTLSSTADATSVSAAIAQLTTDGTYTTAIATGSNEANASRVWANERSEIVVTSSTIKPSLNGSIRGSSTARSIRAIISGR